MLTTQCAQRTQARQPMGSNPGPITGAGSIASQRASRGRVDPSIVERRLGFAVDEFAERRRLAKERPLGHGTDQEDRPRSAVVGATRCVLGQGATELAEHEHEHLLREAERANVFEESLERSVERTQERRVLRPLLTVRVVAFLLRRKDPVRATKLEHRSNRLQSLPDRASRVGLGSPGPATQLLEPTRKAKGLGEARLRKSLERFRRQHRRAVSSAARARAKRDLPGSPSRAVLCVCRAERRGARPRQRGAPQRDPSWSRARVRANPCRRAPHRRGDLQTKCQCSQSATDRAADSRRRASATPRFDCRRLPSHRSDPCSPVSSSSSITSSLPRRKTLR